MTVKELIEKLQALPNKEIDVLISYNCDDDADEAKSVRVEMWPMNEEVLIISESEEEPR